VSDNTKIEWSDATWNPVTGCTEVSPGCDHCYAKTFAERWRGTPGHHFENGFDLTLRPERLGQPLKWKKPRRIFVNSMSDLFHEGVPDEFIAQVFAVMAMAKRHTFQVLTKRHGRMRALLSDPEFQGMVGGARYDLGDTDTTIPEPEDPSWCWPLPNVWLGVSVEDQHWADIRIPALLATPAAVRFLSCEPLLGPVDLTMSNGLNALDPAETGHENRWGHWVNGPSIDWVIVGGESGPGARPMHPDWARSLRDQCTAAGTPFHFKQWGEWGPAPWSVRVDPAIVRNGSREELQAAKAEAEARGATHYLQPWGHLYEPPHSTWSSERDPEGAYPGAIRRWGKKAAGRLLDGLAWDQYPAVSS